MLAMTSTARTCGHEEPVHSREEEACFGIEGFKFKKDHLCGACEAGKMTRAKHPSKTIMTTTHPFELLHNDLFRPTHYSTLLPLHSSMASSLLMIIQDIRGCI